jgi:translation initiation factor 4E
LTAQPSPAHLLRLITREGTLLPPKQTLTAMAADDIDTRPTSAGSRGRAAPEDDNDREEGEIAGDDSSSHAPPPPTKHPLEHAWTFWFDNPQGKSKQAAWGSSIRPIHTFSTVEDFWGYASLSHSMR